MITAAAADTWGISGPDFLLGYAGLAVLATGYCLVRRRALTAGPDRPPVTDWSRRPHDLAYLNGGADLAVYSALSAMHLRGTVVSERGRVSAVGTLDRRPDDLERAIHRGAAKTVHRNRLPGQHAVCTALGAAHKRLVADGLLLSDQQRSRIRRGALAVVAVAALGLVRLLAGMAEARPVGYLVALLAGVVVVAVGLLVAVPRRTRLGAATLARLRAEEHLLSPSLRPDWTAHGPEAAALAVGLFGMSALWASDPAFAEELAVAKAAGASGGGDGGGWGVSSWSSGDGGGGDSGGGSSCGGGGCGGGCGG
jgi:uncharacterized protein (TIGR04222 family)